MKYLLPLLLICGTAWAEFEPSADPGVGVISIDVQGRLFVYCINCKGQKELLCTPKESDLKELKCTKETTK